MRSIEKVAGMGTQKAALSSITYQKGQGKKATLQRESNLSVYPGSRGRLFTHEEHRGTTSMQAEHAPCHVNNKVWRDSSDHITHFQSSDIQNPLSRPHCKQILEFLAEMSGFLDYAFLFTAIFCAWFDEPWLTTCVS
ncbi:hypothetical protein TNCV_3290401 [Trichonephila clavipes]|nr:hypothetical protein TNCV_3290401 [Trichonephila clavipes]